MLPNGAFGKLTIHSTGYGTQPWGSQNMACLPNQKLQKNWRPVVPSQRSLETMLSKEARKDCWSFAASAHGNQFVIVMAGCVLYVHCLSYFSFALS